MRKELVYWDDWNQWFTISIGDPRDAHSYYLVINDGWFGIKKYEINYLGEL